MANDAPSKNAQGDLLLPAARIGKLADLDAASLRMLPLAEDLLISGAAQPGDRSRPLLYGDFRLFHVAEVIALFSSMKRDGTLTLLVPHAKKSICFAKGEIVAASSTVEDDRLGEVLWRQGLISLAELSRVHDEVGPGKRLGKVLVDNKLITPRQLYDGIKQQVQEIVYSTFFFGRGEFLFVEGALASHGQVRLDLDTREIIMEGIQRVEELSRLGEAFPDRDGVLSRRPVMIDAQLNEHEKHLLKLVDGKRSVKEIVTQSHLGERDALVHLSKLKQMGMLDVHERQMGDSPNETAIPAALAGMAKLLRLVHQTLKVESPGAEDRLEAYLGNPATHHKQVFLGVGFDGDGVLDTETLLRNARRQDRENPGGLAVDALRGLYDYALFQAGDVLDNLTCGTMMERLKTMRKKAGVL